MIMELLAYAIRWGWAKHTTRVERTRRLKDRVLKPQTIFDYGLR